MNQPTAPCSPPKTKKPSSRSQSPRRIAPPQPKHDERHQEHDPDQPAPKPMRPLQPEDVLEALNPKTLINQLILRDLLIQRKQPPPLRLRHRRQRARERRPFHDRQPGAGQPRGAPQHDHHSSMPQITNSQPATAGDPAGPAAFRCVAHGDQDRMASAPHKPQTRLVSQSPPHRLAGTITRVLLPPPDDISPDLGPADPVRRCARAQRRPQYRPTHTGDRGSTACDPA